MANNEQMVWRIARFKERCEYRDDQDKKGVLQYTKAFVAAGSDVESRHFMDQLDDLKEQFPKHWRSLEGSLNELVRRSANDVCTFRGWLLHQHQPADIERIARWFRCSVDECLSDLKDLEAAGFIVKVPLSEFNNAMGIPTEKPADSGNFQKNLENPENLQPYKRKRTTGTGKPVSKEKQTETKPKPQPAQKQSKDKAQANLPGSEGETNASGGEPVNPKANENNASTAETTEQAAKTSNEPVTDPTIPDALGDGSSKQARLNPPGSDYTTTVSKLEKMYEPECNVFAHEIFRGLFRRDPFTEATTADAKRIQEDNSEIASFKSAWSSAQQAKPKFKPTVLSELWDCSVAEADKLGKACLRKTKIKNPRAVWWRIFKSLYAKAKANDLSSKQTRFPP